MYRKTLIFLLFVFPLHAIAQYQHWRFGFNAGIHFNPTPVSIAGSPLSTDEGCTTVSDRKGNLLFYTNGEWVWDKTNNVMQNGIGLYGHFSTTQSTLAVPVFSDSTQYILFTLAAQAGSFSSPYGGLSYSKIDMKLNNGNGAVTIKNNLLVTPACEGITATKNFNQTESWVIVHEWLSNRFFAYNVDCDGIVHTPVISSVGTVRNSNVFGSNEGTLGCLAMNEAGTILASTFTNYIDASNAHTMVELFYFDNVTGKLSMMESFPIEIRNQLHERGYGLQFSPDGTKLYCSTHGLDQGISYQRVYQFDLNQQPISSSQYVVSSGGKPYGSIQRAPDNKLYIARLNGSAFLSAIENPNLAGMSCNFTNNAVTLVSGLSTWGLPNHWDYRVPIEDPKIIVQVDSVFCINSTIELKVKQPYNGVNYNFYWSNGMQGESIQVTDSGMYIVEAILNCDTIIDSVLVELRHCDCSSFIPNAFTPNNDLKNDHFQLYYIECVFSEFSIHIFNRWGNIVYASNNPDFKWDGDQLDQGIYIYEMKFKTSGENLDRMNRGTVALIR
ncbi:MAG TPA: gliding motility-associated C-terminal domain-containing protein [Bacteroidia bacterium]|nr:gliding motility-associated C-terminal domain-containing protein [Bacteroidia bacterium]HNT80903.1 gliding motility-associated C-terminal domain-containing protein [Bacteroidia bacterium]